MLTVFSCRSFIADDLRSVDRTKTPWLILSGHRPIYVSSTDDGPPDGHQYVSRLLRAALEDLLIEHKVDVTFWGHHHSYQRTCPMYNGSCVGFDDMGQALGPVHIVAGNAGAPLYMNEQFDTPDYFQNIIVEYGYLRVTADATQLHVHAMSNKYGSVMDSVTLRKSESWHRGGRVERGNGGKSETGRAQMNGGTVASFVGPADLKSGAVGADSPSESCIRPFLCTT
ncbi:unnamed protein product [Ostreobium quekettii]|uniref:Purple acid phosphatase n=1 Tax=Ostreobium quekettii TaxID=121088 RepID=A0A8S1IVY3_9CHLO|nr:unnamed protein product [Ostreobium quekettii]